MAAINITAVNVLNNPTPFTNPLQFEIQYNCLFDLPEDLEWKLTYVGSAESEKYDQILDSVLVGPVHQGSYRFVFQANCPDPALLPQDDIVGVTVLFLSCSYRDKEFIRVGYYVNNDYQEEELRENPPEKPIIEKLWRELLADKPRVTKYPCDFESPSSEPTEDKYPGDGAESAPAPSGGAEEQGGADDMES